MLLLENIIYDKICIAFNPNPVTWSHFCLCEFVLFFRVEIINQKFWENLTFTFSRGIFVLWIWGLMNQFLKDHQLNKA